MELHGRLQPYLPAKPLDRGGQWHAQCVDGGRMPASNPRVEHVAERGYGSV